MKFPLHAAMLVVLGGCAPGLADAVPLRLLSQSPVGGDSLETVHELRLVSEAGDTIHAVLRRPAGRTSGEGTRAGIVLLAGRETGRQAAAVIPGPLDALVLAVEYPDVIPEEIRVGAMLRELPAIRRSAYAVPGVLRGAGHFLARQPAVDPARIGLVGVSFGVPFAAAAARDTIFCCVALHHGGAGLSRLFRANLPVGNGLVRGVLAAFAAHYFRRLEPARHVGHISPRPLLLINGLHDELVPQQSAEGLYRAAGAPVRQIWLPHEHLMPHEVGMMRELADSTLRHFPQLGR